MTTPTHGEPVTGATPPMTPERWRAVDAILQAALACDPSQRGALIADACGDDQALRVEILSLLDAHVSSADEFLERPAAEMLGAPDLTPLAGRLATALAGRYEIEREIGRGGMATVHLARDLRHGRRVAIKVLREELAAAVGAERFLAEIRVTASLQHPHVLPLFDSGSADGLLWYAMPFVDGETLRARLTREGRLPVAEATRLAREIAEALDHAHVRGIVHRDVKPENVLLQDGHAVVADFGIALALEEAGGERITRTGLALGTPQYMAPEQAAGARVLDARADVYALGAVLHEMLAGESPFAAANRQAVVHRLMNERPTALATYRSDVAPWIDAAVQRALAKRPDDRFPSAGAFIHALDEPRPAGRRIAKPELASSGVPPASTRGRSVSARTALYAAAFMLVAGLVGGLAIGRSSLARAVVDGNLAEVNASRAAAAAAPAQNEGETVLGVFDRTGRSVRAIAAERPWTPRFSPDGRRVAYGAFGAGRQSSDLWVTDLETGTVTRVTDDDGDANDPQWNADGTAVAFSANAPGGKDVMMRTLARPAPRILAARDGTQFPSDWLRDGRALLVTEDVGNGTHDILVQPANGSPARKYVATSADETSARSSPDGRWVAYTSNVSGRPEVYVDSYARPGRPAMLSSGGGVHPVWRGDGRELFYWRDGALMSVPLDAAPGDTPPSHGIPVQLFRAPYEAGVNTMYDVSPDGQRFVIVRRR